MLEFLDFTRKCQGSVCTRQPGILSLPHVAVCAQEVCPLQAGQRPENRADGLRPGLSLKAREPEAPRPRAGKGLSLLKQSIHILPPTFCSIQPLTNWVMPAHTGEGHLLRLSVNSNANLYGRHPHRHTQKECLTCCLGTS